MTMLNLLLLMAAIQVAFISFVILWVTKIDGYLQEREDRIVVRDGGDA